MLKKLAATSAAAGLTATIVSSPAFADGGTTNSQPLNISGGTVTLTEVSSTKTSFVVSATASVPTGSCPFGAPSNPRIEYAWSIENQAMSAGVMAITGGVFLTSLNNQTATNTNGNINGTYDIVLTIRWVCDQRPNGATAAWACRSWGATVTQDSSGQDGTAEIAATSTRGFGAICNASPPDPTP